MNRQNQFFTLLIFLHVVVVPLASAQEPTAPRTVDDRLKIELFAEHPQIVTPTGITTDDQDRVFVAESHTHFRPKDYDGPKADRILVFEDTDADGRADKRHVFHEGFTHVMDIQFHPHNDDLLYVATRKDIHRMRDTNLDGVADEITPIVRLETTGTYPHNGLSGLAFEADGSFHFGLGENLGHKYTLIGSDGVRISGGGEGGSTYHVQADGTKLRRVSTGWWNPFGMCVDSHGRVFGTDNDPGASPPCRLIQVFEGGDYGYEYRYGRTGLHPLVSWTGDMRGTIPMIAGTGEAPCAIVEYQGGNFPKEYQGQLFVASWADHRVERYPITQPENQSLVSTSRQPFVEGGDDFRPVGLAASHDGTLFISDWVSSSYSLHKQGRIWRVKHSKNEPKGTLGRWTFDKVVRGNPKQRDNLRDLIESDESERSRVTTAAVLSSVNDKYLDVRKIVKSDKSLNVRAILLRNESWRKRIGAFKFRDELPFALHHLFLREAPFGWSDLDDEALRHEDPVVFSAAVDALAANLDSDIQNTFAPQNPVAAILALKRNPTTRKRLSNSGLEDYLNCSNPTARFLAVKWIADDRLMNYRPKLVKMLDRPQANGQIDVRLFLAISAAIDYLDGKKPTDIPSPGRLHKIIVDEHASTALRQIALRLIDPAFGQLKMSELLALATHEDTTLRLESVRTMAEHHSSKQFKSLAKIAADKEQPTSVRSAAIAGLATDAGKHAELLAKLASEQSSPISEEAGRSLVGLGLTRKRWIEITGTKPPSDDEAFKRLFNEGPYERPAADDLDAWLKLLDKSGDADAGEQVFFGTKVGTCSKCHQVEGRGRAVGPPLTFIGRRLKEEGQNARRWLLETILQPSKQMAPQYTPWRIVTKDGKVLTGLPRRKGGSREAYLGIDGKEFSVSKPDIELHEEMKTSIMPKDLLNTLTRRELNDLFAFLLQQQ